LPLRLAQSCLPCVDGKTHRSHSICSFVEVETSSKGVRFETAGEGRDGSSKVRLTSSREVKMRVSGDLEIVF
jgi:hypothetical protein